MKFLTRLSGRAEKVAASQVPVANEPQLTHLGIGSEHLLESLESLYWVGVERELENVLLTLKTWRSESLREIHLDDESDDFLHGFDTFIDQVEEDSRKFAEEVRTLKSSPRNGANAKDYEDALRHRAQEDLFRQRSRQLKSEIRSSLEDQETESRDRHRARMLLRAIGLLDIEKQIEDRPPLGNLPLSKRPAFPQLQLDTLAKNGVPLFSPLHCATCGSIIRSSMYRRERSNKPQEKRSTDYVCEACYRGKFQGNPQYTKEYKHCILDQAITPSISRKMCKCPSMQRGTARSDLSSLFPVSKHNYHRQTHHSTEVKCPLVGMDVVLAVAKYDCMQMVTGLKPEKPSRSQREETSQLNLGFLTGRQTVDINQGRSVKRFSVGAHKGQSPSTIRENIKHPFRDSPDIDGDIPPFLRDFEDSNPFGSVPMSLRVGPVVLETGVVSSKVGAFITLKTSDTLIGSESVRPETSFVLDESKELWSHERHPTPRRYKGIIKLVAGAPFTGLLDQELETNIVNGIVEASDEDLNDADLSDEGHQKALKRLLGPVLHNLKALIGQQLTTYLTSIVGRLLAPETDLVWSTNNNCQQFCDSLIDHELFGPLVSGHRDEPPLYLFSFLSRPAPNFKPEIKSKFDVPRGLIEECLLRFRCGRHDESDIIDTLQEYWYDWAAFPKPLYKYQDLFPWDCTEAFDRYPVPCGECNLAKHLWAFPFDAWSIVSLHLSRDRYSYPVDAPATHMTDAEWARNRLLVLCALDKLTLVASAMARNPLFKEGTDWIHLQSDPVQDRLKLGGIHRAQPFSHVHEHGNYRNYFAAPWVHFSPAQRVKAYELQRDARAGLLDVQFVVEVYGTDSVEQSLRDLAGGHSIGMGTVHYDGQVVIMNAMLWMDETNTASAGGNGTGGGTGSGGGSNHTGDAGCASNCGTGCGNSSACASSACTNGGGGTSSSGGGGGSGGGGCGSSSGGGGGGGCGGGGGGGCGGGGS